ncbi:RNA polymerase subunit sigma, partial [Candidatus Desantisbacteria bacterium CG_4_10_14_0_8_um_filter_48_22]
MVDSGKPIFEEIFSRYKERIFNFLLRLTRDRQDAEDLASEAFLSVYKNY